MRSRHIQNIWKICFSQILSFTSFIREKLSLIDGTEMWHPLYSMIDSPTKDEEDRDTASPTGTISSSNISFSTNKNAFMLLFLSSSSIQHFHFCACQSTTQNNVMHPLTSFTFQKMSSSFCDVTNCSHLAPTSPARCLSPPCFCLHRSVLARSQILFFL